MQQLVMAAGEVVLPTAPASTIPLSPQPLASSAAPPIPTYKWNVCKTTTSAVYSGSEVTVSWTPTAGGSADTVKILERYQYTDPSGENPSIDTTTAYVKSVAAGTLSWEEVNLGRVAGPAGFLDGTNHPLSIRSGVPAYTYSIQLSGPGGDGPAASMQTAANCVPPTNLAVCRNVSDTYSTVTYSGDELTISWTNVPQGIGREILFTGTSGGGDTSTIYGRIQVSSGVTRKVAPTPNTLSGGRAYRPWICNTMGLSVTQIDQNCTSGITFCLQNSNVMAPDQCGLATGPG